LAISRLLSGVLNKHCRRRIRIAGRHPVSCDSPHNHARYNAAIFQNREQVVPANCRTGPRLRTRIATNVIRSGFKYGTVRISRLGGDTLRRYLIDASLTDGKMCLKRRLDTSRTQANIFVTNSLHGNDNLENKRTEGRSAYRIRGRIYQPNQASAQIPHTDQRHLAPAHSDSHREGGD
jgi:hypothetical protein